MNQSINQTGSPSPVTLISGSQGLAESFFKVFNTHGHRLSVLVRRPAAIPILKKLYPQAHITLGDLTNKEVCRNWIQSTLTTFGRIELLINNAAITGPGGAFHTLDFEALEKTILTNLTSQLFLCQEVIKVFETTRTGTVINLSGGGATHLRPYFLPYSVSKVGIVRATETLAKEYPHLRFFAIAPGSLKTQMMEKIAALPAAVIGNEANDARRILDTGGNDPMKAAQLALWLFENHPEKLNGKVISAIWDDYTHAEGTSRSPYWWTLRRMDEKLASEMEPSSE